MFHGPVGAAVRQLEPSTEAHPVAVLVQVLAMLGGLVGPGPHVLIGGSQHPARLWPLVMGATSKGRKGESRAQALKFVSSFGSSTSYFVSDCMTSGLSSGEGLLTALGGGGELPGDPRLIVTETEFARVLAVGKREGSTLPTILRELWDSGHARTMTKATPLSVDGVHLVVIGHVTPRELRLRLSDADLSGGTLNRFLPVLVERTRLLPETPEPPDLEHLTFALGRTLLAIHDAAPRRYYLSEPARRLWARAYKALDEADTGGLVSEVLGRTPAYTQRIALIYALCDGAREIGVDHLRAGLAVVKYASDSVRLVFGETAGTGDLARLSDALKSRQRMTLTDVSGLFGRNKPAATIRALVDELVETGYAKESEERHEKGRPTTWLTWAGRRPVDPLGDVLGDAVHQDVIDLNGAHVRPTVLSGRRTA